MSKASAPLYQIEKIIERCIDKGFTFYKVKWTLYPLNEATWEPEEQLQKFVPKMLKDYNDEHQHQKQQIEPKDAKSKEGKSIKRKPEQSLEAAQESITALVDLKDKKLNKEKQYVQPKKPNIDKEDEQSEDEFELLEDKQKKEQTQPKENKDKKISSKSQIQQHKKIEQQEEEEESECEDQEYEVEKIIGKKIKRGKTFYEVKWLNFGEDSNTWEPIDNLQNVKGKIDQYEQSLLTQPSQKDKEPQTATITVTLAPTSKKSNPPQEKTVKEKKDKKTTIPVPIQKHSFNEYLDKNDNKPEEKADSNSSDHGDKSKDVQQLMGGNDISTIQNDNKEEIIELGEMEEISIKKASRPGVIETDLIEALRWKELLCEGLFNFTVQWKQNDSGEEITESIYTNKDIAQHDPIKLISYYESKLRFLNNQSDTNAILQNTETSVLSASMAD